jgi:hypothetical protein
VVTVVDGLPNQVPGRLPVGLPIEEADGNSVVLDLGGGRYGLYAHLERGSISVRPGDTVMLHLMLNFFTWWALVREMGVEAIHRSNERWKLSRWD